MEVEMPGQPARTGYDNNLLNLSYITPVHESQIEIC